MKTTATDYKTKEATDWSDSDAMQAELDAFEEVDYCGPHTFNPTVSGKYCNTCGHHVDNCNGTAK